MIHYIFSSESLRVAKSLQSSKTLRILFLVCWGPLGRKGRTGLKIPGKEMGVRRRSGEGVVQRFRRRNSCPKGCFWRVRVLSAPLRFALRHLKTLRGQRRKRTLQKHPFGQAFLRTTPSPLLWRNLKEKRS